MRKDDVRPGDGDEAAPFGELQCVGVQAERVRSGEDSREFTAVLRRGDEEDRPGFVRQPAHPIGVQALDRAWQR